jgi:hypothetical protein
MIPEGTYRAKGCRPLVMTKAGSGGDRAIVTLRILSGPQEGQQIDFRGMLTGGAIPITTESIRIMGYDGETDESVMRNEVDIVVVHEEYDGKNHANIKYVNDPNRPPMYPELTAAESAAAKQRLKAFFASQKAKAAAPVNPEDEPEF